MDPLGWVQLAWQVGSKLAEVIIGAVSRGDTSWMDAKIGDLLGGDLRTTLARKAAEAEARAKFGQT
jgi:hypothetical protein